MVDISSRNLQVRLLILVFIAFLPALAIFWYVNREFRELQLEAKEEDLLQRAVDVSADYRHLVDKGRSILGTLSEFDEVRDVRLPGCTDQLGRVLEHLEEFTTISVIGPDGHLACGSLTPENALYLGDRAYFLRATTRDTFAVGEFGLGRITGRPVVGMAMPLVGSQGTRRVIAASMDLSSLRARGQGSELPSGYTLSILDRNGRILVRRPRVGDFALADSVGAIAGPEFPGPPEQTGVGLAVGTDLDGIERLFAVALLRSPTGGAEGYVAVGRTRMTLMQEVDDIVGLQLRFLAVGGIVLLALAWALGHFFLTPEPRRTKEDGRG